MSTSGMFGSCGEWLAFHRGDANSWKQAAKITIVAAIVTEMHMNFVYPILILKYPESLKIVSHLAPYLKVHAHA
jgi:hypothetical protein